MQRIRAKLTRGEKVLPPWATAKNRARLEEMNRQGLIARSMGGVAAYRANGGAVYAQNGLEVAANLDVPGVTGSLSKDFGPVRGLVNFGGGSSGGSGDSKLDVANRRALGRSLVALGTHDWGGASAALADLSDEEKGEIEAKLAELDKLLADGRITQEQYNKLKSDLIGGKGSDTEKNAIRTLMSKAAAAYSLVNPASAALKFIRTRSEISTTDWATVYAGIAAGVDPSDTIEALTGQAELKLTNAASGNEQLSASQVAYDELKAYLTEMTTVALKAQGSGPKTDFDFEVAERSIANLTSSDASIKNSMRRLIDSAVKTASIEGWELERPELIDGEQTTFTEEKPEVKVDPSDVPDGQRFSGVGYTGTFIYVYNKADDTVTTEGYPPYPLKYATQTKEYFIDDGGEITVLTPIGETDNA